MNNEFKPLIVFCVSLSIFFSSDSTFFASYLACIGRSVILLFSSPFKYEQCELSIWYTDDSSHENF